MEFLSQLLWQNYPRETLLLIFSHHFTPTIFFKSKRLLTLMNLQKWKQNSAKIKAI